MYSNFRKLFRIEKKLRSVKSIKRKPETYENVGNELSWTSWPYLRPFLYLFSEVQWNVDFTIWQGDSKIISLNRDIVVDELQIYKKRLPGHRMSIVKSRISLDRRS